MTVTVDNTQDAAPSQDTGFQADRQPVQPRAQRRPALGAPQSADRPSKKRRKSKPALTQEEIDANAAEDAVKSERRAADIAANLAAQPPFSQISEQARTTKARLAPREPQIRKPWDDHDCALLVQAISEHGSGWSAIEKAYAGAWHRDRCNQIDMKDKARNMKVSYLL